MLPRAINSDLPRSPSRGAVAAARMTRAGVAPGGQGCAPTLQCPLPAGALPAPPWGSSE